MELIKTFKDNYNITILGIDKIKDSIKNYDNTLLIKGGRLNNIPSTVKSNANLFTEKGLYKILFSSRK